MIGSFFNPLLPGGTAVSMDVDFSASTQSTDIGATISFTNLSTPTPIFNFWDFGDGSFSTASAPDKVYSSLGTFSVTLNACDNISGGIETKINYISIPPDPDAANYISRVESADGQSLENTIKIIINNFFLCLKSENIFDDIKTGCILAGARTLEGAIEPLVGTNSPSFTGFTASSYNRKTGLKGSGTNFINTDRPGNASGQNDYHNSVYLTEAVSDGSQEALLGCGTGLDTGTDQIITDTRNTTTQNGWIMRNRTSTGSSFQFASTGGVGARDYIGFVGSSRSSSTEYTGRIDSTNTILAQTSQTPRSTNTILFARGTPASTNLHTSARIAFYSLGDNIDLAKLESCVQDLIDGFDNVL